MLTPCEETDYISQKIQAAVEQSQQKIVPEIVEPLKTKIIASIQQAVKTAVAGIKEEIRKALYPTINEQSNN